MDPQSNATRGLGLTPNGDSITTYDLIKDRKANPAENAVIETGWEGLSLIPAHADLAGADIELANEFGRENRLKRALAPIIGDYDYIFLDTPPSLSLLTVNVFSFATEVLVPCQTHPFAYAALDELFDTIEAIREEINPQLNVTGVVATFFDSRTRVSRSILEKLQQDNRCRGLLFGTVIRVNTAIAESTDIGKPVIHFRRGSYGAEDYSGLARELVSREAA